jgi:hypothetical protein
MNTIRNEVRDLISVHERIQSALSLGEYITDDERDIIRMCTTELLASIASTRTREPGAGIRNGDSSRCTRGSSD